MATATVWTLTAFTQALKKLNAPALDDLHYRLQQALAIYSDKALKEDGRKLRDVHPREWLFSYGMLQVMKPGEREQIIVTPTVAPRFSILDLACSDIER